MSAWTAVHWHVKPEHVEEFPGRWSEMLRWLRENGGGLLWARLVRTADGDGNFISMAEWRDDAALGLLQRDDFRAVLGGVERLCISSVGGRGEEAALV